MDVTVSIATCNRADSLRRALDALLAQDYPAGDFEVIVVDNGSTDHTRAVAERFARRFGNFAYVFDARPGQLVGWHRALAAAQGAIACFIDDDVRAAPAWLAAVGESFEDPTVGMVTGPISPLFEGAPPDWLETFDLGGPGEKIMPLVGWLDFGTRRRDIPGNYVWGSNFSIRRDLLRAVGGFHPGAMPAALLHFYGDAEIHVGREVEASGHRAVYHPDARVTHDIPARRLGLEALKARFRTNAYAASYLLLRKHRVPYDPPSREAARNLAIRNFRDPATVPAEIRDAVVDAYFEGLGRHLAAFKSDPKFRDWVLMDDYLDLDRCYVHPDLTAPIPKGADWRAGA